MAETIPTVGVSLGGKPCLRPDEAAFWLHRAGVALGPWWSLVNSYVCPLGRAEGQAWLLMRRKDLPSGGTASIGLTLKFTGTTDLTFPRLDYVSAEALTPGVPSDPESVMLVHCADKRRRAKNAYIDQQFNVITAQTASTATNQRYFKSTTDPSGGSTYTPWTWQRMLTVLWEKCPTMGTFPTTTPTFPTSTPANFRFVGVTVYDAINDVLEAMRWRLRYKPKEDTFDFVNLGASDLEFISSIQGFRDQLLWTAEPTINPSIWPKKVAVHFPARNFNAGDDSTDLAPTDHMELNRSYVKISDSSITGAGDGTVPIWGSELAYFAASDASVPSNSVTLDARALEYAANFKRLFLAQQERTVQVYSGALDMFPGSRCTRLVWRCRDAGDGFTAGMTTEVGYQEESVLQASEIPPSPMALSSLINPTGAPTVSREVIPSLRMIWATLPAGDGTAGYTGSATPTLSEFIQDNGWSTASQIVTINRQTPSSTVQPPPLAPLVFNPQASMWCYPATSGWGELLTPLVRNGTAAMEIRGMSLVSGITGQLQINGGDATVPIREPGMMPSGVTLQFSEKVKWTLGVGGDCVVLDGFDCEHEI